MNNNNLFPVFLKLENLHTLIIGGGYVGEEKLRAVLKNSAQAKVTLVARSISAAIYELASEFPNVQLVERNFRLWDLWNKDLVLLATNSRKLHASIRGYARERHLLINVADTPDLCDFYLGAVVSKGNLKIAISTNGKSPTISKRLKEYLEEDIPDEMQSLLDNMEQIRNSIKGGFQEKIKLLNTITKDILEGQMKQELSS